MLQGAHHIASGPTFKDTPSLLGGFLRWVTYQYLCIIMVNSSRNIFNFQLLKYNKTYMEGLTALWVPPR